MSIPKMAKAMGYIDDDLVSGAVEYKRTKKKNSWLKWGAMAACLCLVVVGALTIHNWQSNPQGSQDFTAPYYSLSETEHLCIEVVEVGAYTYKAKVVDTGNNRIYPLGEEVVICVNFGETEILLSEGKYFDDTVDDISDTSLRLENIGWGVGSILYVEFDAYTDNNKLFASYVEVKK